MRVLQPAEDEPALHDIVHRFKHTRLRHSWTFGNKFRLQLVPLWKLIHPVVVLLDPYFAQQQYGILWRMRDIPLGEDRSANLHFFHIHGIPFTSFKSEL